MTNRNLKKNIRSISKTVDSSSTVVYNYVDISTLNSNIKFGFIISLCLCCIEKLLTLKIKI